MKIRILFLIVSFSISIVSFSSSSDTLVKDRRHYFSFDVGIQYRDYFGKKFITPYFDTIIPKEIRGDGQKYYGFNYVSGFQYQTSILYHHKLNNYINISAGIELVNKNIILTTSIDSAIKFHNNDIVKYKYNDLYFEAPVKVEFSYKNILIGLGVNFSKLHFNNHTEYNYSNIKTSSHGGCDIDENINLFYISTLFSYRFFPNKGHSNLYFFIGFNYYGDVLYTSAKTYSSSFGVVLYSH